MNIDARLSAMGLELPHAPTPVGSYVPTITVGNLAFTSGQTARINSVRRYLGKVGADVSVEEGILSARDACLNCLACLKQELSTLDRISRIVKVTGFVNSAPGFNQQPAVINGASDLLVGLYEKHGVHVRSAVGVAELPFNASVELEIIVEINAT